MAGARELFFGPPERPLFARLHVPQDARARAGVVLCPPFGLERQDSGRALRALGEALASAGICCLQVDYDGTGDSYGWSDEPDRLGAWQASVLAAAEALRAGGAGYVCLAGMRLGATIAASVSAEAGADALVLWDPCESGRSYLREQSLLRSLYYEQRGLVPPTAAPPGSGGDGDAAGGVEVLGATYGAVTARQLSELSITGSASPLAPRALALYRPGRRPGPERLGSPAMANVEVDDAVGQDDLLGLKDAKGPVPAATIDLIVSWLARSAPAERSTVDVAGSTCTTFDVPAAHGGGKVKEEVRRTGPNGLFGILSLPSSPATGVAALFVNMGDADHTGPSRLWVVLARKWAAAGVPVMRADLSGLGDSPPRAGQPADAIYPRLPGPEGGQLAGFSDIAEMVRALREEVAGEGVVVIGLCAGAYHSLGATLDLGAAGGVRGVAIVNLGFHPRYPWELLLPGRARLPVVEAPPHRGVAGPPGAPRSGPPAPAPPDRREARGSLKALVKRHLPGPAWWLVNRVRGFTPPAALLACLSRRGVRALVICEQPEADLLRRGQASAVRRLQKDGRLRLEVLPYKDHALLTSAARDQVAALLDDYMECSAPGRT